MAIIDKDEVEAANQAINAYYAANDRKHAAIAKIMRPGRVITWAHNGNGYLQTGVILKGGKVQNYKTGKEVWVDIHQVLDAYRMANKNG